jgi:hypothetical protein
MRKKNATSNGRVLFSNSTRSATFSARIYSMSIPEEEKERYQAFVLAIANALGSMRYGPETMLWHYTNGSSLIAILESMSIYSTQISCLNDATELKCGSTLFHDALRELRAETSNDQMAESLLDGAISYFKEDPNYQAASFHFVACFSEEEDDLSQWRAYGCGENGYAIGFRAAGLSKIPKSMLVRVNYDTDLQRKLAMKVATEMVRFFKEGVRKYAPSDLIPFGQEFLEAWEKQLVMIAPMVKNPGFFKEKEYRIAKGFAAADLEGLRFIQKNTMMSRHLPLRPPGRDRSEPYRLPIAKVMVGPSRHLPISRNSVATLLRQKGYPAELVTVSRIPFQVT